MARMLITGVAVVVVISVLTIIYLATRPNGPTIGGSGLQVFPSSYSQTGSR